MSEDSCRGRELSYGTSNIGNMSDFLYCLNRGTQELQTTHNRLIYKSLLPSQESSVVMFPSLKNFLTNRALSEGMHFPLKYKAQLLTSLKIIFAPSISLRVRV